MGPPGRPRAYRRVRFGLPPRHEGAALPADPELLFRPALELAAMVRSGELTARDLAEASLSAIERHDPGLNAFCHVDADGALAQAARIGAGDERPFAGVPIAIKDNQPVAGMPLTFGSGFMPEFVPPSDSHVVRRLREAGFVIVGKTTLPEFGILPVSEATRFGPTRNPWDPERTPGGSSGGSAAAVAGGMVPIAHGNDGGGSTRIPAACCGLVGLKPQRGRISRGPAEGAGYLVQDGVLTRTVADTAAALDVLAGYEPGDEYWAPPPAEPFAAAAARPPERLRIGFTTKPPIDAPVEDVPAAAVRDAAALLASLGHEVEETEPGWDQPGLLALFSAAFGPAVSSALLFAQMLAGRAATADDVERLTWHVYERSRAVSAPELIVAQAQLNGLVREQMPLYERFDVILTPALAERPVRHGVIDPRGDDPAATFARSGRFTPFTAIQNVTGNPAISIPLYQGEDGLPTGVHLVSRPAREDVLLALGAQLEAELPWAERRPGRAVTA